MQQKPPAVKSGGQDTKGKIDQVLPGASEANLAHRHKDHQITNKKAIPKKEKEKKPRKQIIPGAIYATQALKGVVSEDEIEDLIKQFTNMPKETNGKVFVLDVATTLGNVFLLSSNQQTQVLASGFVYSAGARGPYLGRPYSTRPEEIRIAQEMTQIFTFPNRIVQLAAGQHHVLALDLNGFVYSWGENGQGQLGHDDMNEYPAPREIETFKKDPVVQIYAGGDSSFTVTKNGDLYAWGDNRSFQLGILGTFHQEPKLLIHTPWEKGQNKDLKMVYGKNSLGVIFKPLADKDMDNLGIQKSGAAQDKSGQIKELEAKIQKMSSQINELKYQAGGSSPQQALLQRRALTEDTLLRQIEAQIKIVEEELKLKEQAITQATEDINQVTKDLENIKEQLVDISEKENYQISVRDDIETQLRRLLKHNKDKGKGPTEEQDRLTKEQKRVKELLQANENIKNTLIKRYNECEVVKLKKQDLLTSVENQQKDLESRLELFQKMSVERKKTIKTAYLLDNKPDLEKFVLRIYKSFKNMLDTSIQDIQKSSSESTTLEQIIQTSNQRLRQIRQEIGAMKVNPNDGGFDILTRIQEILQDNLNTRLKLNDFVGGLLLQVTEKNNEYVKQFEAQNSEGEDFEDDKILRLKKIKGYIKKQKARLIIQGREMIDVKGFEDFDMDEVEEIKPIKYRGVLYSLLSQCM